MKPLCCGGRRFPWHPLGMLPGEERGSHSSWAGQPGRRCWFLGRLSHELQCAASRLCHRDQDTAEPGQNAARPGAPQGPTWTGTAGCSSNTTDSQPSPEIGQERAACSATSSLTLNLFRKLNVFFFSPLSGDAWL